MPPEDPNQARWFVEQVQPHEPALRPFLRSPLPILTDVADIMQEAYLRVRRVHDAGPIANAQALLYVTARNLALNAIRDSHADPSESLADAEPHGVYNSSPTIPETHSRLPAGRRRCQLPR